MSLYSALFAGVSGLSAESSAMASVADNITNINTVGYKAVDSQFSTLVGDGRKGSVYAAGGVAAQPRTLISKQGLLQASASSTDLGIDGQGFFVTRTGIGSGPGSVALTRAGSFAPDKDGYLRNTAGLYLQGWRLDTAGSYVNTGTIASLEPIRVSDLTGSAAATTKLQIRANFQATTTPQPAYAAGTMAGGTATPDFSRAFDVYDQQGNSHRLTLGVVKTGANSWAGELYVEPASDVTAANGLLSSGKISFNPDGSLDLAGSDAAFFAPIQPGWTNGAGSQPIALDFGSDGGLAGFTQFSSPSAVMSSTIDGGLLGNVSSISVSRGGEVSALFEDGTSRAIFQLPIATVPNPDGLSRTTGNGFTISDDSGGIAINPPGVLGAGSIDSFKLEASTSDLALEFTNMIRFQRAYSASSKIITTVDDMLQEVSNLKR